MRSDNQVISVPLAKRLKELGVKQESLFYWATTSMESDSYLVSSKGFDFIKTELANVYQDSGHEGDSWDVVEAYSAFTVAELGELLPEGLFTRKIKNKWFGCRYHDDIKILSVFTKANTEADARAEMILIYLKKIDK